MISSMIRYAKIGSVLGLLDGLAFTGLFHSAHDTLALIFLIPSIPCYATVMAFPWPSSTPEWLPWSAGVLVMGLVGGTVGAAVRWGMHQIQAPATRKPRSARI
jgi:hypothetical protein